MKNKLKNSLILIRLFTAVMLFASCSDDKMAEPVEPVIDPLDPVLKIEFQSFPSGRDWTNLQTGDIVTFGYTVENIDSIDNTYEIAAVGSNAIFHQIQNTDFALVKKNTGLIPYYNLIAVVDNLSQTGTFLLRILKPGNFHLNFALNKIENGVKTPVAVSGEIQFNAVRIVAYTYDYLIEEGGWFSHGKYNYCHKLYMDTGNQQYDNQYLGGLNYVINFKNSRNQNQSFSPEFTNFVPKVNIDLYDIQTFEGGSSPGVIVTVIDKISFVKIINGNTSYIDYKNITVTSMGGQNAWGPNGNPNP
ncbi:MAG: hypothetical protein LBP85_10260 [Prevotellaceae bacterium]|jgi:hypothetical protein|nr:hypothetical protein [Prevotellaceae bacterium]